MAKCKECGASFGFLELKDGVCKQCINKTMPPCLGCNKNLDETELTQGYCAPCVKKRQNNQKANELSNLTEKQLDEIMLTTENAPNIQIEKRIEIITAECVFGMNIFKDIFAGVRDIVGGRSEVTQGVLKDARKIVLNELRKEAYAVGANAVVAVDLDYNEFSGGGKSMLIVIASGTAVKTKL